MKKKLLSVLLIVVMVLASAVTAFAADITLSDPVEGHTYTAYQIFKGTASESTSTSINASRELTNIQWGTHAPDELKNGYSTAAAAVEELLKDKGAAGARAFAQTYAESLKSKDGIEGKIENGQLKFENLEDGYYIIIDTNNNKKVTEGDYSSAYIATVAGESITGSIKGDKPTSDKEVKDVNDSSSEGETGWQKSADYDIGDKVPFRLSATTANNVSAYKKYHITFVDNYEKGLDDPKEFTVKVLEKEIKLDKENNFSASLESNSGQTKITAERINFTANTENPKTGGSFEIKVTLEPTSTSEGALLLEGNSTVITVEYTSTLNESAVIGSTGNKNESSIRYSNNPESSDGNEEGKTPEVTVIVFTYKLDVDKVDEDGNELEGAGFTLYKKNGTGQYVAVGEEQRGQALTKFSWTGLDDGDYKIEETTVPKGYNKAADIEFRVTADHSDDTLKNLSLSFKDGDEYKEGSALASTGEVILTKKNDDGTEKKKELNTGEIFGEIINRSGATMPGTGGMGTTILYTLGGILVVGAGILLVARRKAND